MPEWSWGIVAGVIASGIGAVITGYIQVWLRKVEIEDRHRRDRMRAALDLLEISEKTGLKVEEAYKKFIHLYTRL